MPHGNGASLHRCAHVNRERPGAISYSYAGQGYCDQWTYLPEGPASMGYN